MSNPSAVNRGYVKNNHSKVAPSVQVDQPISSSDPDNTGQIGHSKVSRLEDPNHASSNNRNSFATDHTLPFDKASKRPPRLDERQLSVKEPGLRRSLSEESGDDAIFTTVNSRRSSFSEEYMGGLEGPFTAGHALESIKGRTADLQSGTHFVEAEKSNLSLENRNQIFLEAFILTSHQVSDEEIVHRLSHASPKELLQFTSAFKEAIDSLLASEEKEKLFDDKLPFSRISWIMEATLQREQEIWCFHDIFKKFIENNTQGETPSELYQNLKNQFNLSGDNPEVSEKSDQGLKRFGEYSDLIDTHSKLKAIFQSLRQVQEEHLKKLVTQKEEQLRVQKLLDEAIELTPQLEPLQERKASAEATTNHLSNHATSNKIQRFFFNQEEEFKEVQVSIREDKEKKALRYFQSIFFNALKTKPANSSYQKILRDINEQLKDAKTVEGVTSSVSEKVEESGLMSWFWSLLGSTNTTVVEPSSYVPRAIETVTRNQQWIVEKLNNPTELARIKAANPENPNSCVTALDQLLGQDPALIITKGEMGQQEGVKAETKSAWSFIRFGSWLFRKPEDKIRYREGIKAARMHVENKYGPDSVERFDAHFALRYRKGSPLTVRALNEFVLNEEKLLTGSSMLPTNLSRGVATLNLEATSLGHFSQQILDNAEAEFDFRYYVYDQQNKQLKRHNEKVISKQDKAVLFASFYQEYWQRPVVLEKKVSEEIQGQGFFKSRWNAFTSSFSHGSQKKAHQELVEKLTSWVQSKASTTSRLASEENVRKEVQDRLAKQNKLTLQDVEEIIEKAAIKLEENNTWANFVFYRLWKPIIGTVAKSAGVAAATALVANDSSIAAGTAKAAALGATLYAIGEDRPGVQLSTALAALWAANNPKAIHGAEHTVVSYVKGAVKYGTLAVAAAHFPPLFLAVPFL